LEKYLIDLWLKEHKDIAGKISREFIEKIKKEGDHPLL